VILEVESDSERKDQQKYVSGTYIRPK